MRTVCEGKSSNEARHVAVCRGWPLACMRRRCWKRPNNSVHSGMAVSARGRMLNTPQRKQAQASSSTDLYPLTSLLRLRWAIPAVSCCAAWRKVVRKKRETFSFGAWATPQHHAYKYLVYMYIYYIMKQYYFTISMVKPIPPLPFHALVQSSSTLHNPTHAYSICCISMSIGEDLARLGTRSP